LLVGREILSPDGHRSLTGRDTLNRPGRNFRRAGPSEACRKRAKAALASTADPKIEEALRKWRLAEAKKQGVPAFRVMTDKTLLSIASIRPVDEEELLTISGVSAKTVQRYGTQILRIVAGG